MTNNDELERQKFEEEAERDCALPWGYLKRQRSGKGYSVQIYNYMWWGWQARAEQANCSHSMDERALEAARRIMALVYGAMPPGGSVQLQAQIQVEIIAAMIWAATESNHD